MKSLDPDAAFTCQRDDPGAPPGHRDGFITLLAIGHLISGCLRLYQENHIFITYLDLSTVGDPDIRLVGPPIPLVALANVTVFFILAAGLGLLLNAKWGWWVTGFVYCYAVVQALYMLGMWFIRKDALQQQGLTFDLEPYVRNLVIYSLLLWYLQSNRVLRSFGLPQTTPFRLKSIAVRFGAAIAGVAITTLLSMLILTTFGRSVPYIE